MVHKNIEIIWTTLGSECVIGGEQLISENGNSEYQGMNSQRWQDDFEQRWEQAVSKQVTVVTKRMSV